MFFGLLFGETVLLQLDSLFLDRLLEQSAVFLGLFLLILSIGLRFLGLLEVVQRRGIFIYARNALGVHQEAPLELSRNLVFFLDFRP